MSPIKLYVHVPFCRSKCAYCDFYSVPRLDLIDGFLDSLAGEWEQNGTGLAPDTLYLGGGTPSALPLPALDRLLSILRLPADSLREATIEANPDDVTPAWAGHIISHTPFTRVSMGIQSFDDRMLAFVGRRHSAAQAVRAFDTLRSGGIADISCDLIYGLPGQTLDEWILSLDRLIAMRPEHISAYLLSYEPSTRLSRMLREGRISEASDTLAGQMYSALCERTRAAGYSHYEISNFALPGHEAIHNSAYWDGSLYLGLGPGAHSLTSAGRRYNPSDLRGYIASGGRDFGISDPEDDSNRYNDLLITSLRTARGLDPAMIPPGFTGDFSRDAAPLLDRGDLCVTPSGFYAIPEDRWLVSNSILLDLIIA